MRLGGRRSSTNVEDRRGMGGARGGGLPGSGFRIPSGSGMPRGGGGGMGIGGIVLVVLVLGGIWLFTGQNPLESLSGGGGSSQISEPGRVGAPTDDQGEFAGIILGLTEETWTRVFAANGRDYPEPTLVLFSGSTSSGCGFASSAVGPFYCPADQQVYIDLDFYQELEQQFRAGGDFARAYVLAHEVGHHVQNVLGIMNRAGNSNEDSIRVELQADCFAGIWGADAARQGLLEVGDLEEALNAAAQIGDDAIQMRQQGYVVPESFNHGSSEQRQRWFRRGFDAGTLEACDTFSARTL
jgi:predicted metalloprotease